jgi:SprT-like family
MNSITEINPVKQIAPPQQLTLAMDRKPPINLGPVKASTAKKKRKPRRRARSLVPGGAALFQRVFTRLNCDGRPPRFRVEFYPYASLVLTIRRREDIVLVRFSDLLQRAPLPVLEGAAALLLSRVYRRRAPRSLTAPYLNYARSNRTRSRISRMRRGRVRLASAGPQGRHFNLEKMFEQLNEKYFSGSLQRPDIGWSTRSWRRQFGCYDPGPNQILLNRRMDHPAVPQVAVEYVLYHEMLHVKHPTRRSGCSLVSHSPEFRAEEKLFPHFTQARKILDRLAR